MKVLPKRGKAGIALLIAVLLALFTPPRALASSAIDGGRLGSLTIQLSGDDVGVGASLSGVEFTIYQVASLSSSGKYTLTNDFLGCGLELDKLSTAFEASVVSKNLVAYVSAKKISGTSDVTGLTGAVKFNNLSPGYYLVVQTNRSQNSEIHRICDPFLVSVPFKSSENSGWIYDITANSKSIVVNGAVILHKISSSGASLPGAVFQLDKKIYYTDSASVPPGVKTGSDAGGSFYWSTVVTKLTTNGYGQLVVTNLAYGQYRFIETSAPAGYRYDSTPHNFSITASGSVQLVDGKYVTASGTVQTITVVNSSGGGGGGGGGGSGHHPPVSSETTESSPVSSDPSSSSTPVAAVTSSPSESAGKPPRDGFDFPKTGGSICYAVCTYGGAILMLCGVTVFGFTRKKE